MWGVQKTMTTMTYVNQEVPDIFVYLVNSKGEKICYARFDAVLGLIIEDKWIDLKPDLSVVNLRH